MSHVRMRELAGIRSEVAQPSEADLELLRSADFAGPGVTAEGVHVREMLLCHNQYDRTLERFPKGYLDRFAETAPGKSVLPCHDTGGWLGGGSLPLGRFFRGGLVTRTEDFPVLVRPEKGAPAPGGGKAELVPGFAETPTKVTYLRTGFYFIAHESTEALRLNIDLGVYRSVSIGFRYDDLHCDVCKASYFRSGCPHWIGEITEDGQLVTATYAGDPKAAEMLEGSIVYLGAQPMARLLKQIQEGKVDPKAFAQTPFGEDLAALKFAEAQARLHGHAQKSWAFPGLSALKASPSVGGATPSVGGDNDTNPAAVAAPDEEKDVDEKQLKAALDAAQKRTSELEAELATERAKLAKAEPLAAHGKAAIADLKADYLAQSAKLGRDESEVKEIADLVEERGDYPRMKQLRDAAWKQVCEKFPAGTSADRKTATGGNGAGIGGDGLTADEEKTLREKAKANNLEFETVKREFLAVRERRGR